MLVKMLAPPGAPSSVTATFSGTVTPDAFGVVTVDARDVKGLETAGFMLVPAFGSSGSYMLAEANIARMVANPLGANLADTTDDVLASFTLPASAFDLPGRGLSITAQGKTGATTNNKRVKLWWNATIAGTTVTGGTVIADTGAWVNGTTPNNAAGWQLSAEIFKYGATGSNTQYAQGVAILGATHGGINAPLFPTAAESGPIVIALTGSSYTTGAAADVIANLLQINAMN